MRMMLESMVSIYEADDKMFVVRFEDYESMYDGEARTGVSVWIRGREVMHATCERIGHTEETALRYLRDAVAIAGEL